MTGSTSKELVRSSIYGFAFILGAFVATFPAVVLAVGFGSDVGFGAVLKFSTMLMPFSNTNPDIPTSLSWPLNALSWALMAGLIGILGDPSRRIRTALLTILVVVMCGFGIEQLLPVFGYRRFLLIDL